VQGPERVGLPQQVHQAALVATGNEDAVGLQDQVGHGAGVGGSAVGNRDGGAVGHAELAEGFLVVVPGPLGVAAGRAQHPDAAARAAAQFGEAPQDHLVVQPVLGTADDDQPAGAAGLRVGRCGHQAQAHQRYVASSQHGAGL